MKLTAALLFATIAFAQNAASAQTPAKPAAAPHPAAPAAAHPAAAALAPGCTRVPELSPKIPALPKDAPCAKPLYTITSVPSVKLEYTSPLEGSILKETLGIAPSTFTLAYIETKVGSGELAKPHKFYTIHYTGYLVDGTKFDSSYDHPDHEPFTFPYGMHQVVVGWDTGFAGMRVGGKRRLFIPYQLGYGPNGKPPTIPAKSELIFDVEFISQSDNPPTPKAPPTPPAAAAPKPAGAAPALPPGSAPGAASKPPSPPPATPPAAAAPAPPPATPPPAANPPKPQ